MFQAFRNWRIATAALCLATAALFAGCDTGRELREGGIDGLTDGDGYAVVGHIPRLHVLYASQDGRLYGFEDHFLYVSEDAGESFSQLGVLPNVQKGVYRRVRSTVARLEPVRRIRNNRGPNNMEVLSSGTILVFYDQIYRSADGGQTFEVVFNPADAGIEGGPFAFGAGTAVGPDDLVFVGEYKVGPRPHAVHVLRGSEDGTHWEVAHRFKPGETFHVHSITYDSYRDMFWVALGDRDEETGLLYTSDGFESLHRLGGGSQDWRIVQLIITPDYLYWGSDNDTEEGASIFRWSFAEEVLEKLQAIGKVSYYATKLADGTLIVSTTYEPESRFSQAHSPAESSEIWVSRDGQHWRMLLELPHEPKETPWGPARAQVAFPSGQELSLLFMIPRHTRGDPFATVVLEVLEGSTGEESTAQEEARGYVPSGLRFVRVTGKSFRPAICATGAKDFPEAGPPGLAPSCRW